MASTRRTFQFSLATAWMATAGIAVVLLLIRWERTFPTWILIPAACFILSRRVSRQMGSPDLAWGFFTLSWLVALLQITDAVIESLRVISTHGPIAAHAEATIWGIYRSGMVFLLVLSLPAIDAARRLPRSPARKWLIACLVLAITDVSLCVFAIPTLLRWAENSWP